MKLLIRIGLALFIVLVGVQLIPTRINQNSELTSADFIMANNVPEAVGDILHTSCYNCHSNNTSYPWYSKVQPIGLLLENHITKGKDDLNFSEFGNYSNRRQKSKFKSMVSQIEKNEMPLRSYTFVHHEARLSQKDKKEVTDYLNVLMDSLK